MRSGQVGLGQVMTRDLETSDFSFIVQLENIPSIGHTHISIHHTLLPQVAFDKDKSVYFNSGVACDRQVTRFG